MIPTLEQTLQASIDLVQAQKLVAVVSREVAGSLAGNSGLLLMPKPPPPGSEIPSTLSPSSTNTFLHHCRLSWFYRKVLKLPETRGAALGLGTAVHTALIDNYRQKIETKEDLDVPGTQAMFIMSLIEQLDEIKLQPDESADDLKSVGETMVRVYMEQAAPTVEPAAVEEHVEGLIGDVPVHGYIDVRDVDGRIIDIKTAKRKPAGTATAHQLQTSTYVMLCPEASGTAQLSTLTKTRTVQLHQDTIEVTPSDRKLTERLYSIARDEMASGVYAPNRSSNLCSRKYCGFWQRCEDEFGGRVRGEAAE